MWSRNSMAREGGRPSWGWLGPAEVQAARCGSADAEDAPGQKQNGGLETGVLWPGECRVTREVTQHSFLRTLPVRNSCSPRQRHDGLRQAAATRKHGAGRLLRPFSGSAFQIFFLTFISCHSGHSPGRWAAGKARSDARTHLCPPGATAAGPTPCSLPRATRSNVPKASVSFPGSEGRRLHLCRSSRGSGSWHGHHCPNRSQGRSSARRAGALTVGLFG